MTSLLALYLNLLLPRLKVSNPTLEFLSEGSSFICKAVDSYLLLNRSGAKCVVSAASSALAVSKSRQQHVYGRLAVAELKVFSSDPSNKTDG